jgi:hypothetical protein
MIKARIGVISSAVLLALTVSAGAQQASQLKVQQQNNVQFVSGGVGIDEEAAMRAVSKQYNLKMSFRMAGTGQYFADVKVKVNDAKGKTVLDAISEGPCFFAQLPPGSYTVSAENKGVARTQKLALTAKPGPGLNLFWPAEPDEKTDQGKPQSAKDRTQAEGGYHACW